MKSAFSLPINIFANFLGRGMSGLIILIATPIIAEIIGIQGYGIIGFYNALLAIFLGFDFGLGFFLQKECARKEEGRILSLIRSLEWIFLALSIGITATFVIAHRLISSYCIHGQTIPDQNLVFILIAICIGTQWPSLLYGSALTGLQRLPQLNLIHIVVSAIRFLGAVAVLKWGSNSLTSYFTFQLVVNILQLIVMRANVLSMFTLKETHALSFSTLIDNVSFITHLSISSFLGMLFRQLDKIVLIQLVSLEIFGYYCLASALSYGLYSIIGPIYHAIFPKFAELIKEKKRKVLIENYQKYCALLSLIMIPIAVCISLFSYEILLLWTQNIDKAQNGSPLLKILIWAIAANGLIHIPQALQLAYGWTTLSLYQNILSTLLIIPILLLGFHFFGIAGFVISLAAFHGFLLIFTIESMHRKIVKNQKQHWYWYSLILPLTISITIMLSYRSLLKGPHHFLEMIGAFLVSLLLCFYFTQPIGLRGKWNISS